MDPVYAIVMYDCNNKVVKLCSSKFLAEEWCKYLTKQGVQCLEVDERPYEIANKCPPTT